MLFSTTGSSFQVLKLYAWEASFQANIEQIRDKEIQVLKQSAYCRAGSTFIWICAPFLASLNHIPALPSLFMNYCGTGFPHVVYDVRVGITRK